MGQMQPQISKTLLMNILFKRMNTFSSTISENIMILGIWIMVYHAPWKGLEIVNEFDSEKTKLNEKTP